MLTIAVIIFLYILVGLGHASVNLEIKQDNPGPKYPNSLLVILIWPAWYHIIRKKLYKYKRIDHNV